MKEAVIVSACRTPIGDFAGSLKEIPATILGKVVILEALRRARVEGRQLDEVIMGCVLPAGLGQNPARQAMLEAELPFEVGAITVNKVCGSGLKSVMLGAQAIQTGDAELVVAGGIENMNLAPYYLPRARSGYRMGEAKMVDGMVHDGLWDHINGFHMGVTAELVAQKHEVSRRDQDEFALDSYEKALASVAEGRFAEEIVSVEVPRRRKPPLLFDTDEVPRPTSMESLSRLRAVFKKDGTVTAGNASKISDGAGAVLLASRDRAEELGLSIMARVVAQAAAGLDPKYVLMAPVLAIPKALDKAGLSIDDIDLWEINEAFAASSVAVARELGLDSSKVNVNGGAIALGHPIGASGARVLVTLLHAMKGRGLRLGVASLCLGGGEAVALVVEMEM